MSGAAARTGNVRKQDHNKYIEIENGGWVQGHSYNSVRILDMYDKGRKKMRYIVESRRLCKCGMYGYMKIPLQKEE